jgi:AraC-like DNA-binding protein
MVSKSGGDIRVNEPVSVQMPAFGVWAFRSRHAQQFQMAEAAHGYHKLCLVEDGQGAIEHAGRRTQLASGQWLRVPPGQLHRFVDAAAKPMTLSVVCIDDGAFDASNIVRTAWRALLDEAPPWKALAIAHPYDLDEYMRRLRQLLLELSEDRPHHVAAAWAVAAELVVYSLRMLGRTKKAVGRHPGFEASLAYIEDHFTEPIGIDEMAALACMSYRGYTAAFKARTGQTVVQYLTRRRLAFARQRIMHTGRIAASALEADFGDISHFYRCFRQYEGTTPARYLRAAAASRRSHQSERA